jgi:uroporphyrinogen III methyltransferase/synthase
MSTTSASYKVISRSSKLALKQVDEVFALSPEIKFELIKVESFGDKHKEISLLENKHPDFFTRELDEAILNGSADLAVHSAKDLPYPLPEGIEIYTLFEAFDKTDALVSNGNKKLSELPTGAKVGTSSLTRKNELQKLHPDITIIDVRGTIEERLSLVDDKSIDALIIASCALKRLGLEHRIAEVLPFETHPLQGHLVITGKSGNSTLKNLFEKHDIRKKYGKVWLVGFGPGDPELLTVKADKILQKAGIIFYDDLIDKSVLSNYPGEKVYVGKRKGNHSKEQEDINELLYQSAIQEKSVVRLKGGDPMIFAHGGEEIEYLQERLIETAVIPGISTGLAASSIAKVPLTHRDISSSVTFISGHSIEDANIPESGTLVFYMGATNMKQIVSKLIERGWSPNTPVLLITNVSLNDQHEYYSSLKSLALEEREYPTPLIIIIGDVVSLKKQKAENIIKPKILVTGTDTAGYNRFGTVIHQPLIDIQPLNESAHLQHTIEILHDFDYVIFTSKHAVYYFLELLNHYNKGANYLKSCQIVSIGKTTSAALSEYNIKPDLQPEDESSEGIISLFKTKGIKGRSILIPRSDIALAILPDGLKALGNTVVTAGIYQNKPPVNTNAVNLTDIQYIAFASPSGVDNFLRMYGSIPENINFIAKGNVTLTRMIEAGFKKDHIEILKSNEQYLIEYEI